jgi:transcriptional regulator GlxA family with amidase domain
MLEYVMKVFVIFVALVFAAPQLCQASNRVIKTIGVLIYDKVLTSDVTAPLEVFGNATKQREFAGYKVVAIAPQKRPISTEEGVVLMPQYSIDDAPALDTLIVGSAYDMNPILSDTKLISWIASRGKTARWIASNCSGARILGDAGLLVGKRVTTYPGGELLMQARYPRTTVIFSENVVVDGNLVTSNGGLVSYTASLKLLEQMTSMAFSEKIAANIYYDRLVRPAKKLTENVSAPMKEVLTLAPAQHADTGVELADDGSTLTRRRNSIIFVDEPEDSYLSYALRCLRTHSACKVLG